MAKNKFKGGVPESSSHRRHRSCGKRAGESPKLRLAKKMEAERQHRKARVNPTMTDSVKKLFRT